MKPLAVAACYCRYSSEQQDRGTSIDVQLDGCRRAAGGDLVAYVDRAKTGRAVANRDALRRLLADAEAGKVSRVFVHKYDRLGRNLAETALVVQQLEDLDVEVLSATEGSDVLARGVQLAVAEHYSRVLSERTRAGLEKRFDNGAWTGGPAPFGYRLREDPDGCTYLEIDQNQAAVVRWIYDQYLRGTGIAKLARALTLRGIPCARASQWWPTAIAYALHNSLYAGRPVYRATGTRFDRRKGRRVKVAGDASGRRDRVDERLRIVAEEVFEAVQRRMRRMRRGDGRPLSGQGRRRALSGLVACPACHGPMTIHTGGRVKSGELRHYLTCNRRLHTAGTACTFGRWIREDVLVDRLLTVVRRLLPPRDEALGRIVEQARQQLTADQSAADDLRRRVADLEAERSRLLGEVVDADLKAARRAIGERLDEVQGEVEDLRRQLANVGDAAVDEARLRRLAEACYDATVAQLDSQEPEQLRELFHDVFGPMIVDARGHLHQVVDDEDMGVCRAFSHRPGSGERTSPVPPT